MRLGQLARKLALRPAEIVTFLAKQNIQIENNGNTRIEDDHVKMIMGKYAPNEKSKQPVTEAIVEPLAIEEKIEQVISEPELIEPVLLISKMPEERVEVVKAPKVELSGLKVLGKIELPEVKKKELPVTDSFEEEGKLIELAPQEVSRPRQERKPYPQKREQRSNAPTLPQKNPIALQREREEKEAEEKRRLAQEQSKEKRALHYLKKVNTKQPTIKVAKVIDEPSERQEIFAKPAPKTVFGKFMRWLSSSE